MVLATGMGTTNAANTTAAAMTAYTAMTAYYDTRGDETALAEESTFTELETGGSQFSDSESTPAT
jgi:hypothetical protein